MITSVFLTNNSISAVLGNKAKNSVHVQNAYSGGIEEGCIINGLITNEQLLKEQLEEFWNTYNLPRKGIRIVVNSSHFTLKVVKIPAMNVKKTREYIVREFTEAEEAGEGVCDFQIISQDRKAGMNEILAAMAEKEFIESYLRLFAGIGVTVEAITPGRSVLIELYKGVPALRGKTCVLEIVSGSELHSALYVNGIYTYSTRSRLFNIKDGEAMGTEIARSVSNMLQFYATQNSEYKLSEVYYAGVPSKDMEYCRESLDLLETDLRAYEIEDSFVQMASGGRFSDYFFPIANLMDVDKKLNLMEAYKKKKDKNDKSGELLKRISPILIVGGGLFLVWIGFFVANAVKQRALDDLNAYNIEPSNVQTYQDALFLRGQITSLGDTVNQVEVFTGTKNSYPKATVTVLNSIQGAAEGLAQVTVSGYTAETGSLQLMAEAKDATSINQFIDRLEGSGMFNSVAYSGYSESSGEKKEKYSINVVCYLAAEAGK